MSVIMTMQVKGDPARLEEYAAANQGHLSGIAERAKDAGVMAHPISGEPSFVLVTYGKVKLANLRRRPQLAATFRSGWQWASVEGRAQIIGPDDPHPAIDAERLRVLLREAFTCAGGTHDNWAEYDHVMAEQRRAAVLVVPGRIYSKSGS